jgi:hypothetical protein
MLNIMVILVQSEYYFRFIENIISINWKYIEISFSYYKDSILANIKCHLFDGTRLIHWILVSHPFYFLRSNNIKNARTLQLGYVLAFQL